MKQGYATLFTVRGAPWRAHFTVLIGLLWVGGLRVVPGAWLAYFVMIAMHELGHALLVRRYGLQVYGIDIHGFGGECVHQPARNEWQSSVIAWGGVLMQLLLFVGALIVSRALEPQSAFVTQFLHVMTETNLLIAAINLLPLPGLDGGRAWKLPGLVYRRLKGGGRGSSPRTVPRRSPTAAAPKRNTPRNQHGDRSNLRLVRDETGDFRFEIDDDESDS